MDVLPVGAFLLGVAIAVASFVAKEVISSAAAGVRFRRRLSQDLESCVTAYQLQFADLARLSENLGMAAAALESGNSDTPGLFMIWDGDDSTPEDFHRNSFHLRAREYRLCAQVYEALIRIAEVRRSLNRAIEGILTSEKPAGCARIAEACAEHLQDEYCGLIRDASQALVMLAENHVFVSIDTPRYIQLAGWEPSFVTSGGALA